MRKARIAKELGNKPQDLSDYRLFFVGLEDYTSSEEERQLYKRYRKDYGDKGELLANCSSDDRSADSSDEVIIRGAAGGGTQSSGIKSRSVSTSHASS